jgi:hypothetical protein
MVQNVSMSYREVSLHPSQELACARVTWARLSMSESLWGPRPSNKTESKHPQALAVGNCWAPAELEAQASCALLYDLLSLKLGFHVFILTLCAYDLKLPHLSSTDTSAATAKQ